MTFTDKEIDDLEKKHIEQELKSERNLLKLIFELILFIVFVWILYLLIKNVYEVFYI